MRFARVQTHRKTHIRDLQDVGDYCVSADGALLMRCPVDKTLADVGQDQFSASVPFKFPCGGLHWFRVRDGKLESSVYGYERCPVEGFDRE